jgi:hypothetical protein
MRQNDETRTRQVIKAMSRAYSFFHSIPGVTDAERRFLTECGAPLLTGMQLDIEVIDCDSDDDKGKKSIIDGVGGGQAPALEKSITLPATKKRRLDEERSENQVVLSELPEWDENELPSPRDVSASGRGRRRCRTDVPSDGKEPVVQYVVSSSQSKCFGLFVRSCVVCV